MPYDFERDEFRYDQRAMRDNDRRSRENEARIDDARRELERLERRVEPVERIAAVVNDPDITLTPDLVKVINDPALVMDRNGSVMKRITPQKTKITMGRGPLYLPPKFKRTRRKTKMDKTMSKCLQEAQRKNRNKNGKLKKGKTMVDVMKMAHKLCRKEMGTKKGMVRKTARRAYEKK